MKLSQIMERELQGMEDWTTGKEILEELLRLEALDEEVVRLRTAAGELASGVTRVGRWLAWSLVANVALVSIIIALLIAGPQ